MTLKAVKDEAVGYPEKVYSRQRNIRFKGTNVGAY